MATRKQAQAAKRNVKKAQKAAAGQKTIAHLPADTTSALGQQGAAVAQRKRTGGTSPKTRAELYEIARKRELPNCTPPAASIDRSARLRSRTIQRPVQVMERPG